MGAVFLLLGLQIAGAEAAFAGQHPWHATQTDGGYYYEYYGEWTLNAGMNTNETPGSPWGHNQGQRALFHLYFSTSQTGPNQNTNFYDNASFEEVGTLVGALANYGGGLGVKFYWASCYSGTTCNASTGYFEGPMSPTPAITVGHTYAYEAVAQSHSTGGYWWDLYIRDTTTNGNFIRGGGREFANSGQGCCSSFADWGFEGSPGFTVNTGSYQLPQTDVILEDIPILGNWQYWGPSTEYGPNGGPGQCWFAENTQDNTEPGCSQYGIDVRGNSTFLSPWYYYRSYGYTDS